MNSAWIAFFVGIFLGMIGAVVGMSILIIGRRDDDNAARMLERIRMMNLLDALKLTRANWIHGAHARRCLSAIATAEEHLYPTKAAFLRHASEECLRVVSSRAEPRHRGMT